MESLKLSLKRQVVEVELEKEDGSIQECLLYELNGADRDKYLSTINKTMRYDEAGKPVGLSSFDGLQSGLLRLCLFDKATGESLSSSDIQSFPARVVNALFTKAQEMNGLNEEGVEAVKND